MTTLECAPNLPCRLGCPDGELDLPPVDLVLGLDEEAEGAFGSEGYLPHCLSRVRRHQPGIDNDMRTG